VSVQFDHPFVMPDMQSRRDASEVGCLCHSRLPKAADLLPHSPRGLAIVLPFVFVFFRIHYRPPRGT